MSNIDALKRARETTAAKRAAGEKIVQLSPAEKAARNPTSRSLALAAKCFDCVGGEHADGGYRRCIRECPSTKCALHGLRPYQRADQADDHADQQEAA